MAIKAQPTRVKGAVPYDENVKHPAFDQDVINSGILLVSENGVLIKRQNQPAFEELEIGPENIVVRNQTKQERYPIPKRLAAYLSVLRAVILETPDQIDPRFTKTFEIQSNRWTATITAPTGRKETIALSGCGQVLETLRIGTRSGQQRQLRFLPQ